jgi:lysozyme
MSNEREQLIFDEGLRLKPYKCTEKKITIGIGRNLEDNPLSPDEVMTMLLSRPHIKVNNTEIGLLRKVLLLDFYENGITRSEAYYLFDNDVKKFSAELRKALPWVNDAPEEVQNILLNMTFNMGIRRLLTFNGPQGTLRMIQRGEYQTAAENLKKSLWYRQVTSRAERLINRLSKVKQINT